MTCSDEGDDVVHTRGDLVRPLAAVVAVTAILVASVPPAAGQWLHGLGLAVTLGAAVWGLRQLPSTRRASWRLVIAGTILLAVDEFTAHVTGLSDGATAVQSALVLLPALTMTGTALLAIGIASMVRSGRWGDQAVLLDAVVVGTSVLALTTVLVSGSTWHVAADWMTARLQFGVHPLLQLVLLFTVVRLVNRGRRGPATNLLATGVLVVLGATIATAFALVTDRDPSPGLLAAAALLGHGAIVLALLVDDADGRTVVDTAPRVEPSRAALLLAAMLLLPLTLLLTATNQRDVVVALMTTTVLLVLSVRLWLLLHELRRASDARVASQARRDERRFAALVRHMSDVLLVVDDQGIVTFASPSAARMFRTDPTGWHVRDIVEHLHPSERKATIGAVVDHINRPSPAAPLRIKTRLLDASDAQQYLDITVADLRDDNDVAGVVLTMQETTERTDLIRQVRELARRDSLTGLANRDVFNERLEHALARASREGRRLAVLTCDLDDFKDVNDTLGHAAGDVVLQTLSSRIQAVLRSSDTLARFGGDEFAVLCEDIESTHDAGLFARAVLGTTDEAVVIDGHRMRLGMSIGVVVDSGDRNAVEILRDADIALYEAKGQGKRRWVLHRIAMTLRNRARLQLADDLAHALADGALDVAYQPIVDLQHGDRIVGVEALVRWDHPEQGQLSPDAFVAIAERSGMVTAIGTFLLDEGLQTLRRCLDRDPELVLRLAVNVSVRELREPLLINHVVTTLDRYAIDPDFLVLEVTESSMFDDTDLSLSVMRQLREQGVRFAVDDFGTGYSSLAYLKQLPVDIVKVDQSFIADLDEPVSVDLVRAIVEIGRTLRLDVCAEGVETAAQHDALVELGCAFGQGFHHSRPMSADELLGVLAAEPERFVQRERSS